MVDQTARQRARRTALDAQARMRARRAEQERRRDALGVEVITALAERDAVVSVCEARAGAALVKLTEREGLNLTEAVEWCGGAELLTVREAARLRQLSQPAAVIAPVRGTRTTSADATTEGARDAGAGDGGSGGDRAAR
ncbi:hypothetical protein [Pengzhenrongella frigida]|uniref:Uncharacterized protein n=1 Tax=Pengzhenrongella frigida TaxID=1259133 RepID=A0A4Q5MZ69_9MICO|nr:hypothetical protein [Cellulomonas sp. HLT2-17]RYV50986.1 hypothetical protein EUA98_10790 [Cellulomonas sp. HLT2-17]